MNKRRAFVNIGYSSILTVFVMICLVTFSVLTFTTANADLALSKKTADHTKDYYNATNTAEALISEIDSTLSGYYTTTNTKADYAKDVSAFFSGKDHISDLSIVRESQFTADNELGSIYFSIYISDSQSLDVTLKLQYPKAEGETLYTVQQYQIKTTEPELSPEDTELKLLQ